jgi:hypothetical protein
LRAVNFKNRIFADMRVVRGKTRTHFINSHMSKQNLGGASPKGTSFERRRLFMK